MGYQTPSLVCMLAMPHKTAGDASGEDPTYWVKWSIICATFSSWMYLRTKLATEVPIRKLITSAITIGDNAPPICIVSRNPPTLLQKKNLSDTECNLEATFMNCSYPSGTLNNAEKRSRFFRILSGSGTRSKTPPPSKKLRHCGSSKTNSM